MNTTEITNRENTIDSREVIERIEELESLLSEADGEAGGDSVETTADREEWQEELESAWTLTAGRPLAARTGRSSMTITFKSTRKNWPMTLAQSTATPGGRWGASTAEELQMDYMSIEFASQYYSDQQTYWGRA
jgi:hypothetical protein